MLAGTFNSGFLTVADGGRELLDWWAARTRRHCIYRPSAGMIWEQSWLALAPAFFEVEVLRDAGVNAMTRELLDRDVEWREGAPWLSGRPLRAFHFSGPYDPHRPERLLSQSSAGPGVELVPRPEGGRPLAWLSLAERPGALQLSREYAERLLAAGFDPAAQTPAPFLRMPDGRALTVAMRSAYRDGADRGGGERHGAAAESVRRGEWRRVHRLARRAARRERRRRRAEPLRAGHVEGTRAPGRLPRRSRHRFGGLPGLAAVFARGRPPGGAAAVDTARRQATPTAGRRPLVRILFAGSGPVPLSGGSIMSLLIARELIELGHEVEMLGQSTPGAWAPVEVPIRPGSLDDPDAARGADAVITGSFGAEAALAAGAPVVCQLLTGYEPDLWPARRDHFERIFRLPTLKLAIAAHIRDSLRRDFGIDSVLIGAPIDLAPFAASAGTPSVPDSGARIRALTVGPEPRGAHAPVPFKGIAQVLEIVTAVRERGHELELVRLTPREDELAASSVVDELHVGIPPARVPAIYRSCDVYVGASTAAEGLGMPAVEAACAGLALLLPAIPSYLGIEGLERCARFYEPGDVAAAVAGLSELLDDPALRERLATAGPVAGFERQFSPRRVAERAAGAIDAARRVG